MSQTEESHIIEGVPLRSIGQKNISGIVKKLGIFLLKLPKTEIIKAVLKSFYEGKHELVDMCREFEISGYFFIKAKGT